MKNHTTAGATVTAPADEILATIAAGSGVHQWFGAVITGCEVKGSGAGAERFCTMANGAELKARILGVDHLGNAFRCAIDQNPPPASEVVATIDVADLGDGKTKIAWGAEYGVEDAHAEVVGLTLSGLYAQPIQALEAACTRAQS